ncbi:cubilin-like [Diabrotica virgifera virgifera]|uniref:Cubilin n=5 Tax=Diabrotica virgifera virgifera TaxID=50390 RepID=A0ABM5JGU9_DIAVI|nr:cubilin-like [Diabrotica virgifera virgifera]
MGVCKVYILLIVYINYANSLESYSNRPRIKVTDGDLQIIAPSGKNVEFVVKGEDAMVSINQINVLKTLTQAQSAIKLTASYQHTLTSYSDRLEALETKSFENPIMEGNFTNATQGISRMSFRKLSRRVDLLQKRITAMLVILTRDDCASNPCKNGGTCQDLFGSYFCQCPPQWEGSDCTVDVNECNRFQGTDLGCQNGAVCVNTPGSYRCDCVNGYIGLHCLRKSVDCATAGAELCGHGTCISQNNQNGYKCLCDPGWTTDGKTAACNVDVNECSQNHPPCAPNVECVNVPGSFYCGHCPPGFTGNGYHCTDIDECVTNNGGCSMNPLVLCLNTHGSRSCGPCPSGYLGNGMSCTYQGVCNINNGGCHQLATCSDSSNLGTVQCVCPLGYAGTGTGPTGCVRTNTPLHACQPNPCVHGRCTIADDGNYHCNCYRFYTGATCDTLKSDACTPNPCKNNGECQSVNNRLKCVCKSGFTGAFCQTQLQGCGGYLRGDNGTLKFPAGDFATYNHRSSCAWKITLNSTNKVIKLNFTKFDLEDSPNCGNDWLEIHDGPNTVAHILGRFCGNKLPLNGTLTSTHDTLYLWFRSDVTVAKDGFQLTWTAANPKCDEVIMQQQHGSIQSPGSPGNYPLNRDCHWTMLAKYDKRFLFHFFSLNIGDNSDCSADYLEFFPKLLPSPGDQTFAKFCNSSSPEPFYSPGNRVNIHFHSDGKDNYPGFQITYSIVEGVPGCGGVHTAAEGVITSSHADTGDLSVCQYKIQGGSDTKIKINFMRFDLPAGCSFNYLELHDGADDNAPSLGRFCGNNLPHAFISQGNQLTIVSSSTGGENKGWTIEYVSVCSKVLTDETGSLNVLPNSYDIFDCIYQIQRPPGNVIILFMKVNLPSRIFIRDSVSRYSKFVEVRDGDNDNSTLIGKYSGITNVNLTSTHNFLWIRVRNYRRFNDRNNQVSIQYTSMDVGCGGILRKKFGNIASPSHSDGYYPPSLNCKWTIIAPPMFVIQLTWMTFNIESSYECAYDYVQVFDNNTDLGQGEQMGKFCGFSLPPMLLSSSNIMSIFFTTDVTVSMDGFLASYIFIHEKNVCGGNYFTTSGVIRSPKYPEPYPTNRECTWTINIPPGQQILLNITDFNIEYYSSCRYDWLEIRNGGTSASPLIGKFCGTTIPKQIVSHANKLYLFFKSDLSRVGHGFRISWSSTATGCGGLLTSPTGSLISPHYPEPYARNTECIWKIVTSAGSRIQAVFSDINLEKHMQCLADYVQLFDGLTLNTPSLGKFCYEAPEPIKSSSNQMLVKFRSDVAFQGRGFQLHYTTVCHNTVKGFRGIIESPNFPNNFPQDQDCLWEIQVSDKNKINITFSHFELERSLSNPSANSSCLYDFVEISYAEMNDDFEEKTDYTSYGKYCGSQNPGHLSLNSDHVQVRFVSDKLLLGTGFRLEWEIFGCGGILKKNSGTITSPNYPYSYPPSVICEWRIEVDFGQSIEIEFHEIDVEKDTSCDFDSVSVYNGIDDTYNLLATICRQKRTSIISSTGNYMFVKFKSDYSYHGKGFTANYTTVPTKCGGRFTASEGYLYSPNYPKNYNKNETCEYFIDIDEGHVIEFVFEDVDLFKSDNCSKNYVKIHDGPSAAYPVLQTACGSDTPNGTITSSYNNVFIEFRSHSFFTTKGFKLKYYKSCGSKITTSGNGIIGVHHDEFSDNTQTCTWTIISSDPSKHIHLTVTQLQGVYYCVPEDAPLEVRNGQTTDSPLLGQYCGPKIPPKMTSDGSALTIHIKSQLTFFATYSVYDSHCGGTLEAVEGYFSTPEYPKKYPSDIKCEWTLKIAEGNHVTLNFMDFSLLSSENCNTDFLEIRSRNASGKLLGLYCGTNTPSNITNVGSLWLLFQSSKIAPGDNTVTAKGFYAQYVLNEENELSGTKGQIESPLYPLLVMDYKTYTWKITVASKKRIRLSFKEFYLDAKDTFDDECYFATFEVFDGMDDTATSLAKLCGISLPDPITTTSNVMFIKVDYSSPRMGSKFRVDWEQIDAAASVYTPSYKTECNNTDQVIQITNGTSYILSSPGYPHGYDHMLKCSWVFSTIPMNHLSVYFMDIDLAMSRSRFATYRKCDTLNDNINIYQKHFYDNDWTKVQSICKMDDAKNRIQATDFLKVEFVTTRYINGTGFRARIVETCGGELRTPTGYIIYGNSSVKGSECQWNITVGSTKIIELIFEEMHIDHDTSKGCDNFLMLRNGKFADSPLLGVGKYCGHTLPEKLTSTGNNLYIKYKGSMSIEGFRLKYQEVSAKCGGNIILSSYDNFTEISSPNYPNIPNPHIECNWRITAPLGEILRIDFEDRFDLTNKPNCDVEYVEIRDGGTEHSSSIGKFCRTSPSSVYTTDNMMFIKFFTDTDEPKNGFKAKISMSRCGGTVRGRTGELSYTGTSAMNNNNCTWHIVGPEDHFLIISLKTLDTTCGSTANYVTVYEDFPMTEIQSKNGMILTQNCGKNVPPTTKTESNSVRIVMTRGNVGHFSLKYNSSQTECGGKLNTESGVIESPGYPSMHHLHRVCHWEIVVPEGRRITFKLIDLDLGGSSNNMYDRGLELFDDTTLKVRRALITTTSNETSFQSSSNVMFILFWSISKSEHRGFKATYQSDLPTLCQGDFSKENGVITNPETTNKIYSCQWVHQRTDVAKERTFAVALTVNTSHEKSESACSYSPVLVEITAADKKTSLFKVCATTTAPVVIRSPFLVTKLSAAAAMKFTLNFTATYSTHDCGGMVHDQSGVISSPGFPNKPSKSYECAWLLSVGAGQTINITTLSLSLGDDCEKSYLVVYNGELPTHPRIGKFCKNTKPEVLISQSNKLWIEYKHDQTSTGTGFMLKYEAMSSGCGGVFHDLKRTIRTPNYGVGDYPHKAECLWIIESEPGYHIKLNFVERFFIEQSTNCTKDYVEIWSWDLDHWTSLGRKCGRDTPTSLQSKGERMKILFRSNEETAGAGFKASWEWLCGGTYLADKKTRYIVSPGYPMQYKNNLKCEYTIETKSEAINLRFLDFVLETGRPDCKFDNLTIAGKTFPGSYVYTRNTYCGDNSPESVRMRGTVILTFMTDRWVTKRGFKLEYKDDSCGETITEETVIEKKPTKQLEGGSYRYYQPKIKCIWNITAPANQIVVLHIKKLGMFTSTMCYGQNVEVFSDVNMDRANRLAQLCGSINDSFVIPSETGKMIVKLETLPMSFGGFIAEVSFAHGPAEGCGGHINLTDSRVIESPNLSNLDCVWQIVAPRDHQIEIKINHFNMANCAINKTQDAHGCIGCSMLEIRDGASPFSEKIETLCVNVNEADNRPAIRTSGNFGYIRLAINGLKTNAFKVTVTSVMSICGESVLTATTEVKTLTSPGYDTGHYPSYIKCSYAISTGTVYDKIVLHFDEFDITDEIVVTEETRDCIGDYIQIYEDPNLGVNTGLGSNVVYNGANTHTNLMYTDVKGRHLFCGKDEKPFDYYTSGRSVTVSLVSKDKTPKGKGFKLEYSRAGCNRNYTEPQGRITNGNSKVDCKFSIIVAENSTISVYFYSFYMYLTANCTDSAMEVRDGSPTGKVLLKACGYRLPDPIFSTTNKLYFTAFNHKINGLLLRYDMLYVSTDDDPGCGGSIFTNKGKIYSPLYPNLYRKDKVCVWTIKAPVGLHLALKFTTFDIQGSCDYTNLRVDTGANSVELCKNADPRTIYRSKSTITITYTSSIHNGGTGWIAIFQAVSSDVTDIN